MSMLDEFEMTAEAGGSMVLNHGAVEALAAEVKALRTRAETAEAEVAALHQRLAEAEAHLTEIAELLTATGVAGDYDHPVRLARTIAAYCACASPHPAAPLVEVSTCH